MPEIQTNNLVDHGQLKIQVTSSIGSVPIPDASIEISYTGDPDSVLETVNTDEMARLLLLIFRHHPSNTVCHQEKTSLILNII